MAPAGDAREALRELNADADVVYAELDARRHAADVDPGMDDLWGLENIGQNLPFWGSGTTNADMDVTEAWQLSTGGEQTVAVVDSGSQASHPDLTGRVFGGYDWVTRRRQPGRRERPRHARHGHGRRHAQQRQGHRRSRSRRHRRAAPRARLPRLRLRPSRLRVRVRLGRQPRRPGRQRKLHLAHPLDGGVQRDCGSSGDSVCGGRGQRPRPTSTVPDPGIRARTTWRTCCASARRTPTTSPPRSRTTARRRSTVFAPGVSILSTYLASACALYCFSDGTSMASPHVAAEAALLEARDPSLTAAAMKAAILDTRRHLCAAHGALGHWRPRQRSVGARLGPRRPWRPADRGQRHRLRPDR